MIRSLFLVSFFLISCNNDSSEIAISKDIDFNIMVNDYKLVDSDSLQVKLSYHNPDLKNIRCSQRLKKHLLFRRDILTCHQCILLAKVNIRQIQQPQ